MITIKRILLLAGISILILSLVPMIGCMEQDPDGPARKEPANNLTDGTVHDLPDPIRDSEFTLEEAFRQRRSVREYTDEYVSLSCLSQILWATQGISDAQRGFRTVPSAGALYPLNVRVISSRVEDLPVGVYLYDPESHRLILIDDEDRTQEVYEAALSQNPVKQAAFNIIIAADYDITATRYGGRAERYVHLEAGHAGQNLSLQAVACGLATVPIGAFDDDRLGELSGLSEDETPLYLFPVGHPAE